MKIILKHMIRNILENRFISMLIICSLTLSAAALYLNLTIKDQMMAQYKSILQGTYQDYGYYIYKNGASNWREQYFRSGSLNLPGSHVNSMLGITRTTGVGAFKGRAASANIYGMDLQLLMDEKLLELKQAIPGFDPSSDKQIIVSEQNAEKYGWQLNDVLTLSTLAGEEQMTVGGIARMKGFYLNERGKVMLMASFGYVGRLNGMGEQVAGVYVKKGDDVGQDRFLQMIKEDNPGFTCQAVTDEASVRRELESMNQVLLVVLLAVMLLVFYLGAGNTKILLARRMPVIGTFRSIGATRFSMNLILLNEQLLYGLTGGVLGLVLGILLKDPVLSSLGSYGESASWLNMSYSAHIGYALLTVGLTAAFQLLVSAWGIMAANRRPIKAAIFNTASAKPPISVAGSVTGLVLWAAALALHMGNTGFNLLLSAMVFIFILTGGVCLIPLLTSGVSALLSKAAGKLFGAAAELGSKNLSGNKAIQSSITLVTVALSLMLTVYLATFTINDVFAHAGESFEGDIQLTGISEPAEAYSRLLKVQGVESLTAVYYRFGNFTINHSRTNVGIFGLDREMLGVRDLSGRLGQLSAGEALIDKYYGPLHQLDIGDTLAISGDQVKDLTVTIVGYIDSGHFSSERNVLVIPQADYLEKVSTIPSTLNLEISGDANKVKDALIQALAGTGILVQSVDEVIAANKSQVDSLLLLVNAILGLAVLIAVAGVMVNQLIGFLQRKKEYAVLYSVGMSRVQIIIMLGAETAGMFMLGCLFAGALGAVLSKALQNILFSIGQYVTVDADMFALLRLLAAMFLLLMLTIALPVRRLLKLDVVREIRGE